MSNIIRVRKRKKFTIINRALLEDSRLQWSTRGMLAYLLCKQDDWILRITDLKNQGDLGRDAIYKRLKNAIEYGYISRMENRNELGRIVGVEYIVHEESMYPLPEKPEKEKQDNENQYKENRIHTKDLHIVNNENSTTTKHTGCCGYVFHKDVTDIQKHEIEKLISPLEHEIAQDLLFELAGYIDKRLIKKDEVSLIQGFVRKVQKGEFDLRMGIKYKEAVIKASRIKRSLKKQVENSPELVPANINNSLVKKILDIQSKGKKCSS